MKIISSTILMLLLPLVLVTAQSTLSVGNIFDEINRLVQVTYPDGTIIQYTYDKVGNRTQHNIAAGATPADLVPVSPALSNSTAGAGGVLTLSFTLNNTGQLIAGANETKFYLNSTNTLAGAVLLDSMNHSSVPPAGMPVSRQLTIPANTGAGQYYLLVQADADNTVPESNENNNLASIQVNVTMCSGLSLNFTNIVHATCNLSNGSVTASISGGVAPYTYTWNTWPPQTGQTAGDLPAGNYQPTATDANGCTTSSTVALNNTGEPPASQFSVGTVNNLTVSFLNQSGGANNTYFWNFGNGVTSTVFSPMYTYPFAGTYTVCLTATNTCGSDQNCFPIVITEGGCGVPTGLVALSTANTSAIISWNYIAGADSFEIRHKAWNGTVWQTATAHTNLDTIVNLVAGNTYECQVRSRCGADTSGWSNPLFFAANNSSYFQYDKFFRTYNSSYLAECSYIEKLADGGSVLLGKKLSDDISLLVKIDAEGNIVWERELSFNGLSNIYNAGIKQMPDGTFIGCFWYSASSGKYVVLSKFDSQGLSLWSKQIVNEMDNNVAFTSDGQGNVFLTYFFTLSGSRRLYSLIKINSSGSIVWSKQFEKIGSSNFVYPRFVKIDASNNIFVGGGFATGASVGYFIAKHSPSGALLWKKIFNESGSDNAIVDIEFDSQGNIYFLANKNESAPYIIYGKLNSSGVNLWLHSVSDIRGAKMKLQGNALFFIGSHFYYSPLAYQNGICIKTDTAGNIISSYMVKKNTGDNDHWEINNFYDGYIDAPANRMWICGKLPNPNNVAGGYKSMGVIKTDLNVDWGCLKQNYGYGTAGSGTFSEWSNTIVSDTLILATYNAVTFPNNPITHQDSIVCGTGCNVLSGIFMGNDSICSGAPFNPVYNGANATTFIWLNASTGDTISLLPNPALVFNTPGLFQLKLVAKNSLCSDTAVASVMVLENPVTGFWVSNPTCANATNGSLDILPSGGANGYTVQWSNGSINPWLTNLPVGYYSATVSDGNGCTVSADTTLVPAYQAIIPDFADSTYHLNLYFDALSQGINYASWDFGDGTTVTGFSGVKVYAQPGQYNVCVTMANPCDTASICRNVTVESCLYYWDGDSDGYGDPLESLIDCGAPAGYVQNNTDCDDANALIHPEADEICDGQDNDCDGAVDNSDPSVTGQPFWFADADGDGYGNPQMDSLSCTQPAGFVANSNDCNDANSQINGALMVSEYKLLDSLGDGIDFFGAAVAVSGNMAIVGAYNDERFGSNAGSINVYQRSASGWEYSQVLSPVSPAAGGQFAYSLAMNDNWIVAGSLTDHNPNWSGAITIFKRDTLDSWTTVAKIKPSDVKQSQRFGQAVSLYENWIAVGSPYDTVGGVQSGSVYIFKYNGTNWVEFQKLAPDTLVADQRFGASLSVKGGKIAIGSPEDNTKGVNAGAAYVFGYNGVQWVQSVKLYAADYAAGDQFGYAVCNFDTATMFVGSPYDDDSAVNSGSVYGFAKSGTQWTQQSKLHASAAASADNFGSALACNGTYLGIGEPKGGNDHGAVYLFKKNSAAAWVESFKIEASDGQLNDYFGSAIALSEHYCHTGAKGDDDKGTDAGSAYVLDIGREIPFALKALLQGPYNIGTQLMNDQLRTKALIPVLEPFTGLGFIQKNGGGGEKIADSLAVLGVSGANAIVDWVLVELRNKSVPSEVLATKSALLQRDGDIVGIDGQSSLTFQLFRLPQDSFYVAVRHRNHLGVMTGMPLEKDSCSVSFDFTNPASTTYGTNAQKSLANGVMAMWGGNANGNNTVRATGPPSINDYTNILNTLGAPTTIQNNVYKRQDLNMDGVLRVTGPPSINDYTTLLNILGSPTTIITATF